MKFPDLHQDFIRHLQEEGRAHATVLAYGKDIEQLLHFLHEQDPNALAIVTIGDITTDHIDEFKQSLKKLRYTPKSVSRKINSIKTFFRFLKQRALVQHNPAEAVIHPKYDQTQPRILGRMEYRALRDVCKHDIRVAAIVELLLQTGMRISELAGLRVQDLDFDKSHVRVADPTTKQERIIPLNQAAKKAVQDYIKIRPKEVAEQVVFLTKTCRPFLVRNIRASIDRYFRVAGIADAKVNDLRHTFIIEQLKAGTPLTYLSRLVGHKRVTTTERYLDLIQQTEQKAPMKLEEL